MVTSLRDLAVALLTEIGIIKPEPLTPLERQIRRVMAVSLKYHAASIARREADERFMAGLHWPKTLSERRQAGPVEPHRNPSRDA